MSLEDFLPEWRHTETIMILNDRISLDNFLQLILPHVDCSVTWCNISETCKTANIVCNRLLVKHYDELGREDRTELPNGMLHGFDRVWYSGESCHQIYISRLYISGKSVKKYNREWGLKGYLKYAVDRNGQYYQWDESGLTEGKLITSSLELSDTEKKELSYIKELPDYLK